MLTKKSLWSREVWHPTSDIHGSVNKYLAGKCIVVGLTGSVAVYKSIDMARWLIRRGANVIFAATRPVLDFIGEKLLYWASGTPPIIDMGGEVEHISLMRGCDGMIVAPATLSTLSKMAYGVLDNPVSLMAVSFAGQGKPVVVVPAMHYNMMNSRAFRRVIDLLVQDGIKVIPPIIEEDVAKYPDPALVGRVAAAYLSRGEDLRGKTVLVTAGATREWLDPVRFISNPSSGRMGVEVAVEAWARGARVVLVHGAMKVEAPHFVDQVWVNTTRDMMEAVERIVENNKIDIMVATAAPADYTPEKTVSEKIRSGKILELKLVPTPKVVKAAFGKVGSLVVFAAETVESVEDLVDAAREKMDKYGADVVVANNVATLGAGFGSDFLDVLLLWRRKDRVIKEVLGKINKEILARRILDTVLNVVSEG